MGFEYDRVIPLCLIRIFFCKYIPYICIYFLTGRQRDIWQSLGFSSLPFAETGARRKSVTPITTLSGITLVFLSVPSGPVGHHLAWQSFPHFLLSLYEEETRIFFPTVQPHLPWRLYLTLNRIFVDDKNNVLHRALKPLKCFMSDV
jgi:hypothetical protein